MEKKIELQCRATRNNRRTQQISMGLRSKNWGESSAGCAASIQQAPTGDFGSFPNKMRSHLTMKIRNGFVEERERFRQVRSDRQKLHMWQGKKFQAKSQQEWRQEENTHGQTHCTDNYDQWKNRVMEVGHRNNSWLKQLEDYAASNTGWGSLLTCAVELSFLTGKIIYYEFPFPEFECSTPYNLQSLGGL